MKSVKNPCNRFTYCDVSLIKWVKLLGIKVKEGKKEKREIEKFLF